MQRKDGIDWTTIGGELAVAGAMADAIRAKSPEAIATMPQDGLRLMRGVLADQIETTRALLLDLEHAEARLAGA